jgi:hypothetical protein
MLILTRRKTHKPREKLQAGEEEKKIEDHMHGKRCTVHCRRCNTARRKGVCLRTFMVAINRHGQRKSTYLLLSVEFASV